jgi:hypothetical protein
MKCPECGHDLPDHWRMGCSICRHSNKPCRLDEQEAQNAALENIVERLEALERAAGE